MPTVTPLGMRANTGYINFTKGTSSVTTAQRITGWWRILQHDKHYAKNTTGWLVVDTEQWLALHRESDRLLANTLPWQALHVESHRLVADTYYSMTSTTQRMPQAGGHTEQWLALHRETGRLLANTMPWQALHRESHRLVADTYYSMRSTTQRIPQLVS